MAVCFGQMSLTNFLDLGWWIGSIPRSSARKTQDRRPAERQRARTKKRGAALSNVTAGHFLSHGVDLTFGCSTQKTSEIARCRIVARHRHRRSLNSGIYAPTSSLDGLRRASLCARSFRGERPQFADC